LTSAIRDDAGLGANDSIAQEIGDGRPTPIFGGRAVRYIDSGTRDAANAVGTWLSSELNEQTSELRIQSGFFSRDALRPFLPQFEGLVAANGLINVVIGSNDGQTLATHLSELVEALALPRPRSKLGVIYLNGAFYHPKTIHISRADGSQTAYVGSANFTLQGIAAKHVEAGLLLDTRDGDSGDLLAQIAAAADAWFAGNRLGIEQVFGPNDVAQMLADGIIRAAPAPRAPKPVGASGQPPARPTLNFLVQFAQQQAAIPAAGGVADEEEPIEDENVSLAVVQHTPPYPPYMYFAPDAEEPTSGAEALTGAGLGDATGLLVQLSRDNDRHWREASGTANLSVPVSTASTFRFGVYGARARPRAEFDLRVRYMDDNVTLMAAPRATNIMSFGHTPGDGGHADLRLVIPKPPIAALRAELIALGLRLPTANDIALLEWPTPAQPTFSMTLTDPDSALGQTMRVAWQNASAQNQMASRGACWLPAGLSPAW
jgi:hypothetical protein